MQKGGHRATLLGLNFSIHRVLNYCFLPILSHTRLQKEQLTADLQGIVLPSLSLNVQQSFACGFGPFGFFGSFFFFVVIAPSTSSVPNIARTSKLDPTSSSRLIESPSVVGGSEEHPPITMQRINTATILKTIIITPPFICSTPNQAQADELRMRF